MHKERFFEHAKQDIAVYSHSKELKKISLMM
jgi:hypothetical protein